MAVNLQKGQKISLNKEAGSALTQVVMGLGWDAAKKKGFLGFGGGSQDIDLDASCLMFDAGGALVDAVWFRQLRSKDSSIEHTGDNRTGDGAGDDEQIKVALDRVPATVKSLVFTVNCFTGQDFSQVENAFCRILDGRTQQEIAATTCRCRASTTRKSWPNSIAITTSGRCTPLAKTDSGAPLKT